MTLLDRVREWLFGADKPESPGAKTKTKAEATPEESDEPLLDPNNVTEIRSTRDDDPVSQLHDIQEEEGEKNKKSDD